MFKSTWLNNYVNCIMNVLLSLDSMPEPITKLSGVYDLQVIMNVLLSLDSIPEPITKLSGVYDLQVIMNVLLSLDSMTEPSKKLSGVYDLQVIGCPRSSYVKRKNVNKRRKFRCKRKKVI